MIAVRAVHVTVFAIFVTHVSRFHFQLQTNKVSGQWAQQQVGVFSIAFFYVYTNQQLATAVLLKQIKLPIQKTSQVNTK